MKNCDPRSSTPWYKHALVITAVLALPACASVDKVKDNITDRFGGNDEQTTLQADGTPAAPVKSDKELQLTEIQQSLDQLGYGPGRTDGRLDSQTEAAIQDFQLDHDLRINGRPSASLLDELKQAIADK